MARLFGTDGVRGIANTELSCDLAFRLGQASAYVLASDVHRPTILVGRDTRLSGEMLESALVAGICSVGARAVLVEVLPTPAIAYLTRFYEADAGAVISASHNTVEYNGIKFFDKNGYKLPDATEAKIEEKILSGETIPVATRGEIGVLHHGLKQSKLEYIHHLTTTIDSDLSSLRVLVDCANGAASATAPELFGRFKCYADFIHREPNGTNINDRCGSTHLESLGQRVVAGKYDVGVAFDGDADRCLMVDELGHEIDGDKIMAVCGKALRQQGKLTNNAVVATVMSNLGLHEFCRNEQIELVCTAVGDRHVLEKMLECDYAIGGEQSGHMIFREYATTGDGELTALQFLKALKASGKSASELAGCCAQYPQELVNVALPHTPGEKERVMNAPGLWQAVREKEAELGGQGRILIRPSGTEALIRVMVEAKTDKIAREVAEDLAELVKKL